MLKIFHDFLLFAQVPRMAINEDSLLVLLNAKAKESVDDVFMTCFRYRHDGVPKRVRFNVFCVIFPSNLSPIVHT